MNSALVHCLTIMAFMIISFIVQSASHFLINQEHFMSIAHLRQEPIMPMGLAAMVIQGAVISLALRRWRPESASVTDGLYVSAGFGLFLVAYISLVEPAKYVVPNIGAWVLIETTASAMQFLFFGIAMGLIHSWTHAKKLVSE